MTKQVKVGVIGATGAVGLEVIQVLKDRNFPLIELQLFASARSAGKKISTAFGELTVQLFSVEDARKMDIIFLAVSGTFALKYAKDISAMPGGALVIDNSSAFRLDDDVPLVIPEINGESCLNKSLIANPNCTTAIAAMALWPIHCKYKLKKVIISTYQASSGAGVEGMDELKNGARDFLDGKTIDNKIFSHPLPFNVIPHIDTFQSNLYTREEMKVTWESRKIFNEPNLQLSCTAVRVPTIRAHAEAVTLETQKDIDPESVREILNSAPGVDVIDDVNLNKYPMPLNASKKYNVEVGRIRQNIIYNNKGLDLFVCGDQLLRGAALNAVLIAEYITSPYPPSYTKSSCPMDAFNCLNNYTLAAATSIAFLAGILVSKKWS